VRVAGEVSTPEPSPHQAAIGAQAAARGKTKTSQQSSAGVPYCTERLTQPSTTLSARSRIEAASATDSPRSMKNRSGPPDLHGRIANRVIAVVRAEEDGGVPVGLGSLADTKEQTTRSALRVPITGDDVAERPIADWTWSARGTAGSGEQDVSQPSRGVRTTLGTPEGTTHMCRSGAPPSHHLVTFCARVRCAVVERVSAVLCGRLLSGGCPRHGMLQVSISTSRSGRRADRVAAARPG
jgi:hypothetical protein